MTIEDTLSPELLRIKKELERLNKMKIHVGIQGASGYDENGNDEEGAPADLLTIANVHEFGATIKAKNVKNLAIPIAKKAIGKARWTFQGCFSCGRMVICLDASVQKEKGKTRGRRVRHPIPSQRIRSRKIKRFQRGKVRLSSCLS